MNRSDLSLEQEYALQLVEQDENIFITGSAGTGKTCLIKQIVASAIERKKVIQVCAMTGCAAILLGCHACTLHSWSGIRLAKGTKEEIYDGLKTNKKIIAKWRKTNILVVDEVSMMSKRLFDLLNYIGKRLRNQMSKPFGGLQLIFTGDFYQLPPVSTGGWSGSNESSNENGMFCFESDEWYNAFPKDNHIVLNTIFRQKDPVYRNILNRIRIGSIDKNDVQLLNSYVNRPYDIEAHNGCVPTKLYAIHKKVEFINQQMFRALDETCYEFNHILKKDCIAYVESCKPLEYETLSKCKKELNPKKMEMEFEYMLTNCPCERILYLKKGANVMCTVNLDIESGICNGSIGIITGFHTSSSVTGVSGIPLPEVLFSNGARRLIGPKYWQSEEYPTLAMAQIPLRLAWAMTIHKIQGATLSMAEIDIGNSIFEYGQTYVALSRVQTLDGLYLSGFQPNKIKVHPKVCLFYTSIPHIEYEEDDDEAAVVGEETDCDCVDENVKIVNLSFDRFAYERN